MFFGLIKPNDWKTVFESSSKFKYSYRRSIGTITCVLKYSYSRKGFKIEGFGLEYDQYKKLSSFQDCLNKQIELEKYMK